MAETAPTFPIVEIFGPVIQGEGAMIGQQTHFVRLGGCDYRCAWCDTMYAVLPDEVRANSTRMSGEQIACELRRLGKDTPWVTLSGGNPALHKLDPLVAGLKDAGFRVTVETQGTLFKPWLRECDLVTVSPKPPSSGMDQDLDRLERFTSLPGVNFKIVVFDDDDFRFARRVHAMYPGIPCYLQVGNDVGNDTTETLLHKLDWLATKAMRDPEMTDTIVLPQLHVLMYGNRRGV